HNNLTLEMGGKSAAILFDDANFENSLDAMFWNSVYYAGQVCTRTKRLLIHKNIYEKAKARLLFLAKKFNNPHVLTQSIGPIITKSTIHMLEHRISKAVAAGNILLEGGKHVAAADLPLEYKNGNFFPITVLEIKNREVDILQRETFAPVLPLIPFETLEEASVLANETKAGLSANIFTENEKNIAYLIEKLDAGMIFVNDSEVAYPGGNYWKGAGGSYLATGSDDRFECMFVKKVIWQKKSSVRREYWFAS
ncbi:MAG: aldehyde dehydrogenase family protein, partial [Candidatus Levyibacteriota bacterium]